MTKEKIAAYLNKHDMVFVVYATMAAFMTYSCMYAFRKAFSVGTFEHMSFLGIDYKILLITIQIIGYTLSKLIGIRVVSEISPSKRAMRIIYLISLSGASLFFFAIVPAPYNLIFIFFSALPLGMIYGLVFGFLEGRKFTDILALGLMATFIFSSAFVKFVGKFILVNWHINEFWMPFVTSMLFFPLLIFSVYLLHTLPPPSEEDKQLKTERKPMDKTERKKFVNEFRNGLIAFVLGYVLLLIIRDFRDNFAVEIWSSLGYSNQPEVFTKTEIPIAIIVLFLTGFLIKIKDNYKAFRYIHFIAISGSLLLGLSTLMFDMHIISPMLWVFLTGIGLYVAYVPCNSLYFERLIASFKYVSTAGFLITLADFYGYFASVGVLIYKNFAEATISYLTFYKTATYIVSIVFLILLTLSHFYFKKKITNSKINIGNLTIS